MKEKLKKVLDEKMTKGKKKGFTLVELLVVIAIIAVLATVSIVGYLGFTSRAKESNDISLTTQMNTVLTGAKALEQNKTMSDALEDLSDAGIDVEKLTPTSDGYAYLWDSTNDQMILIDKDQNIVAPSTASFSSDKTTYFTIIHESTEATTWSSFSHYIATDYTFTTANTLTYTTLNGIDTGAWEDLTVNISSNSESTILINMNGGTLNLTTPNATVNHYGETVISNVTSVDTSNSYHEYGTTEQLNLAIGHVEVENGGVINTIDATSSGTKSIMVNNGGTVGAIITDDSGIASGNGSYEIVASEDVLTGFTGGTGLENSPYLISSYDQWLNFVAQYNNSSTTSNSSMNLSDYKYWKVLDDLNLSSWNYVEKASAESNKFEFHGSIDFDNHSVTNSESSCLFDFVVGNETNQTIIKNLELIVNDCNGLIAEAWGSVLLDNVTTDGNFSVTDNNSTPFIRYIDIYRNRISSSSLYGIEPSDTSIIYRNCVNNAVIKSTADASAAIFVGSSYGGSLQFINCSNYATLLHTSGYAALLIGNAVTLGYVDLDNVSISNCVNYGNIFSATNVNLLCGGEGGGVTLTDIEAKISSYGSNLRNAEGGVCEAVTITDMNNGDSINLSVAKNASASTYELTFTFWAEGVKADGVNACWGSLGYTFTIDADELDDLTLANLSWKTVSYVDETDIQNIAVGDGILRKAGDYYVFMAENMSKTDVDHYEISKGTVSIIAYDSTGNILNFASDDVKTINE